MSLLSVIRSNMPQNFKQTVIDVLPKIKHSQLQIEDGDLFVTKNISESKLTYQHVGMVSNSQTRPLEIIDCTNTHGCKVRTMSENLMDKNLFIVRLPADIPYRAEIIREGIAISKYLINNGRVKYLEMENYKVGQFLRLLVGRCMGQVGWNELYKYIDRFLSPYIQQKSVDSKTYVLFCSRFSLIIYQLAAWYVWEKSNISATQIAQWMNEYFAFEPKYCRPWHVLMLGRASRPWTVYQTTLTKKQYYE